MMPLLCTPNDTDAMQKRRKSYYIPLNTDYLRLDSSANRTLSFIRVILENMIHLLESSTHSLRNEEICPDTSENTEYCEENVCAVASVLDERWSDETLYEILE